MTAPSEPSGNRRWRIAAIVLVVTGLEVGGLWWWFWRHSTERAVESIADAVDSAGGRFHTGRDVGCWIDLSNTGVDDAWLESQQGALERLQRVSLDLSNTNVTRRGLATLEGMESISQLNLAGTKLADADCQIFATLPYLVALDIGHTGISDAAFPALSKSRMLNGITIDRTQATPAGVSGLAQCGTLRGVTLLDADLPSLTALTSFNRLFGLRVRADNVDASCLPVLSQFRGLNNLTLYDSNFSESELVQLRQSLSDCRVEQTEYAIVEAALEAGWKKMLREDSASVP